jgi:hypothetical protein
MSAPKRIQLRRTKGWRKPEGAVVVTRPGKWGNPFRVGTRSALARVPALDGRPWQYEGRVSADGMSHDYQHADGHWTRHTVRYMTAAEAIECYRALLLGGGWPLDFKNNGGYYRTAAEARAELAGRDLACWCPLDQPCHADVLLELARGDV